MSPGLPILLTGTIASIELLHLTGLMAAFRRLSAHGRRSGRLLVRTGVSEWAKERALRLSSLRMFGLSLGAAGRLAIVAAPFLLMILADRLRPFGLAAAWADWPARIALLGISIAYALIRRAMRGGERTLQRIALGSPAVLDASFDIEKAIYGAAAANRPMDAPIFIAGLARAGTSILTRALHAEGGFASLSYRDLPFPLAPNLWGRISRNWARSIAAEERGHGDGILHDLDSPEAIEEVFWRLHEGHRYRQPDRIVPAPPEPGSIAAFRTHVRLTLLRHGGTRYLSKNNANVLRLPAIVEAFPDAHLIHPFRDPVQQAQSLLNQHLRACDLAKGDPFRARFMAWLGHHEFGVDHRPTWFPAGPEPSVDPTRLDYWLRVWIATHRFLLDQPETVRVRQIFLDYDAMCAAPQETAQHLGIALGLEGAPDFTTIAPPRRRATPPASERLVALACRVHGELVASAGTAPSPSVSALQRRMARA